MKRNYKTAESTVNNFVDLSELIKEDDRFFWSEDAKETRSKAREEDEIDYSEWEEEYHDMLVRQFTYAQKKMRKMFGKCRCLELMIIVDMNRNFIREYLKASEIYKEENVQGWVRDLILPADDDFFEEAKAFVS